MTTVSDETPEVVPAEPSDGGQPDDVAFDDGAIESDVDALEEPAAGEAVVAADAPVPTVAGTWVAASAVCDLKTLGRLLDALWLATEAAESLESRAPGTLSPSSLTLSACWVTSGSTVAAKAVGAVTAKVPTRATEAQPATVGSMYFIVTAFSRKSGKRGFTR